MLETHVYEVVGEALFRRSGNNSREILQCKIVRTRARLTPDGMVMISVLVTGYESLQFPQWFNDWTAEDNMPGNDFQGGRPVDVAVPVEAYEHMLSTGYPVGGGISNALIRRSAGEASPTRERNKPFNPNIAAVLIDGRWVEPL